MPTGASRDASEASRAEESDFQAFMERHLRFAFRVAYALLRNPYDADDVVQECFLRLYRKRAWRALDDERAYLARVVWRLARDRQRRPRREESGIEMDTMTATDRSPESTAVSRGELTHIHRMIDALPEELRQPLVLSTIDELTSAQIASALDIPEGTVRTRIHRARQLLKQKLANTMEGRHAG